MTSLASAGYAKRSILGPQALKDVQGHVFGRKGLVSERKMFNMLAAAAGAGRFNDKLASSQFGVYRVIRCGQHGYMHMLMPSTR